MIYVFKNIILLFYLLCNYSAESTLFKMTRGRGTVTSKGASMCTAYYQISPFLANMRDFAIQEWKKCTSYFRYCSRTLLAFYNGHRIPAELDINSLLYAFDEVGATTWIRFWKSSLTDPDIVRITGYSYLTDQDFLVIRFRILPISTLNIFLKTFYFSNHIVTTTTCIKHTILFKKISSLKIYTLYIFLDV